MKRYKQEGKVSPKKPSRISRRRVPQDLVKGIIEIVVQHPGWSSKKVSQALGRDEKGKFLVGNHGVQNVFARFNLNTIEKRQQFSAEAGDLVPEEALKLAMGILSRKPALPELSAQKRLEMIERVLKYGEPVSQVCQDFGISRATFYKWLKRYQTTPKEEKVTALEDKEPQVKQYYRQTPEKYVEAVLAVVARYPGFGVSRVVEALPRIAGKPIVGHHGVQNILRRHDLNTYEKRLTYAQSQKTPWVRSVSLFEDWGARFAVLPVEIRTRLVRFVSVTFASAFTTTAILGIFAYLTTLSSGLPVSGKIGMVFASVALLVGSIFFAYSMKYYLTMALVLSFSRQSLGEEAGLTINNNGFANGNGNGNGGGFGGLLRKIFSPGNGNGNGNGNGRPNHRAFVQAGGLQPSLDHIQLNRKPFVSIHLPMYNEKRVAERLIKACASMDYYQDGEAQFEILVCDDSTDETVQIVERVAKEWNEKHPYGPKVRILHRPTRAGFKGAALGFALKKVNPKTEFIVVFDADFVPYPDTLEMFVKYLKANGVLKGKKDTLDKDSRVCAVTGYQWHVLNKSENWVTRGVRTEYAGSYVIERPGREILGLIKQIHGTVYMIRKDALEEVGWGTSITEDFQLTLKLYEKGYKIVYTPYVQAPAECVSTIKRLIRQRMRWAEGHSNNIRRMFWRLIKSPNLTLMEKLEVVYLAPYYLQAFFFLTGTFCWLISETVFKARLPFWTSLWGWSLVLTNFFSLPLMNAIGLFLEEAEERDYLGILSFIVLCYLVVPFQAYAALKGFIRKDEGPWFRTPKTGKITDIFTRGSFYRWIAGILPGSRPAPVTRLSPAEAEMAWLVNPYVQLTTANNQFNNFAIKPRRIRWVSKVVLVILLTLSVTILSLSQGVREVRATNWSNLYLRTTTNYCSPNMDMITTAGSSTSTIAYDAVGQENCWYSESLPTEAGDGNTGAGPWTFEFHGAWTGGTTGDSLTIDAQVALVDASGCANPSTEDTATTIYTKNTTFPNTYTITLTNNGNTAIQTGSPKRIRLCLQVTGEAKSGGMRLDYNNSHANSADSNLAPSTLTVPERVILLIIIAPFIPMVALWLRKRKEPIRLLVD